MVCVGVGLAGLFVTWRAAQSGADVWVAARPIAPGQVIGAADVRPARVVVGTNVVTWPVDRPVTGAVALVAIDDGAMLTAANVGETPAASGMARMGVVVDVGKAPVASLHVGDAVTLIGPDGDPVPAVMASAPVPLPDAARDSFDVEVAWEDAPRLAVWVALGQVLVVAP